MSDSFHRGLRPTERREMYTGPQDWQLVPKLNSPVWKAIHQAVRAPEVQVPVALEAPMPQLVADLAVLEDTPLAVDVPPARVVDVRELPVKLTPEAELVAAALSHAARQA